MKEMKEMCILLADCMILPPYDSDTTTITTTNTITLTIAPRSRL